ncbi:hypothetical protein PR001_g4734 [Phytophthora rubi]|nr:hypothetical protein PR001_g4734 [Phytophthora rubi]
MERLVIAKPVLKKDDIALYEALVDRAREQQHYYMLAQELKQGEKTRSQNKNNVTSKSADMNTKRATTAKHAVRSMVAPGERSAILNGVLEVPFRADTGADCNVVTRRIANELVKLDGTVVVEKMATPVEVEVADGRPVKCTEQCSIDVQLLTAAGPVRLRRVTCVVMDGDADEVLIGDETLKSLGINVDQLLEQLAGKAGPEEDEDNIEEEDLVGTTSEDEILERIDLLLADAIKEGFPQEFVQELREAVKTETDIWRTKLGSDPPAKLEPLRVVLVGGSVPYRTKPRQYSAAKTKFLSEYGKQLEKFELVFRNNQGRWACAAIPVRKKGPVEEYRCANDYRPMNKKTIPIAGAMPYLLVVIAKVKGACFFATFDLFKGFWQLLMHPDCREFFSFITNDTVYTPTRVPQGATDSPIHFQNQMQEVFRDMLYENVLIWVDDIVVLAKTAEEFIAVLRKFFSRIHEYGLKLNAKKSCLYAREISWCGRIIDGDGVRHDPERVTALSSLPLPVTAADLQKILCAENWLRESIVDFAQHAAPLQDKLEAAFAGHSRKQRYAESLGLSWTLGEE